VADQPSEHESNVAQPLVQASLIGEAIDGGPIFVFVADEEMRLVAANAFACELLGYSREELLRLKVTDIAPFPETPGRFAAFVAKGRQEGTFRVVRKDGTIVKIAYRAAETRVAGLTLYVSTGWPLDDGEPTGPPAAGSPPARATG
jgi:PAS domain S-box-containing protein